MVHSLSVILINILAIPNDSRFGGRIERRVPIKSKPSWNRDVKGVMAHKKAYLTMEILPMVLFLIKDFICRTYTQK